VSALGLVTVHHEGAGVPTDEPRGRAGGYTWWVGPSSITRLRSPYDSFATLDFNHVSVDVCLSGDRDLWPVTHDDLARLTAIAVEERRLGELIRGPLVRPHKFSPGSNTRCPGDDSMADWPMIGRCFTTANPNPVAPHPSHPTLMGGAWGPPVMQLQHELDVACGYHLLLDGKFGPQTSFAVHAFQAFMHLAVDGIAGPHTWAVLDYCYALRGGR
jgi:hypothetical protein